MNPIGNGQTLFLRRMLALGWTWLRRLSGEDAYERYLEHCSGAHPSGMPLSRSEFERHRLELKWSRISRCC